MGAPIHMRIDSTAAHLPVVRGAVRELCLVIGFNAHACGEAVAGVDEALANILQHAYGGRPGRPIEITLRALDGLDGPAGVEVVLRDRGRARDIACIQGRPLEDIRPGGLGTHIIDCCMDVVEYTHPADGGTCLRLCKFLGGAAGLAGGGVRGE
ncbi:MAG: ATP-binding protein [Planctomycetes bacterium]|nr:ATP-binding protein [Planctomycetota bacterium]